MKRWSLFHSFKAELDPMMVWRNEAKEGAQWQFQAKAFHLSAQETSVPPFEAEFLCGKGHTKKRIPETHMEGEIGLIFCN